MKKIILIMTILAMAAWNGPAAALEMGGIDIHGFISQGFLQSNEYNYLADDTKDGSFDYNETGINFSKGLTDKLRIGLQIFSRNLGDVANNKITLDWAYADYRWRDWLGLRAGRIKLPSGLFNEIRDYDMLRTCIVLPQGIYPDLLRDNLIATNGVGLYGNVDLKSAGSLEYQALTGALDADTESGVGKYAADFLPGVKLDSTDNDTIYAGALRWETPLDGLKLGYSIFDAPTTIQNYLITVPVVSANPLVPYALGSSALTADGSRLTQIYSAEYVWNDLVVTAEYMLSDNKATVTSVASPTRVEERTYESYYLMVSYRFTDLFSLGAYYSEYYPDRNDKDGENLAAQGGHRNKAWEKDLALTLRFDINPYWILKIEGHRVDGTANVLLNDNTGNNFSEDIWYYGAAKLSFSF